MECLPRCFYTCKTFLTNCSPMTQCCRMQRNFVLTTNASAFLRVLMNAFSSNLRLLVFQFVKQDSLRLRNQYPFWGQPASETSFKCLRIMPCCFQTVIQASYCPKLHISSYFFYFWVNWHWIILDRQALRFFFTTLFPKREKHMVRVGLKQL